MILDPTIGLTFTFQDLVGSPMGSNHDCHCSPALPEPARADGTRSCDRLMRIHLPGEAVREMTLVQYQEFLVSYRFTDAPGRSATETSSLRGVAQHGSRTACVAAISG